MLICSNTSNNDNNNSNDNVNKSIDNRVIKDSSEYNIKPVKYSHLALNLY